MHFLQYLTICGLITTRVEQRSLLRDYCWLDLSLLLYSRVTLLSFLVSDKTTPVNDSRWESNSVDCILFQLQRFLWSMGLSSSRSFTLALVIESTDTSARAMNHATSELTSISYCTIHLRFGLELMTQTNSIWHRLFVVELMFQNNWK